ncbi:hypothetical protein [Peribacillus simplex]|uniref:hypothetical protein n=1 Tax=Peribacillus simplex TaxID=1478 RepID=UPI001E391D4D|nr:hypothetical protein [Peribacillus simplex]WHX90968.1 hypothetical protein QNH50_23950 [Peribacillus simplex]
MKNLVASSEGLDKSLQSPDVAIRKQAEAELDKKVKKLLNSGVTIHTALDTKLQTQSKTAVQSKLGVNDIEGALVVIQHHTHELVSLIGGKNYKKNSFNRAYQSYRQPGSAIKPLLDYAPHLEKRMLTSISSLAEQAIAAIAIVQRIIAATATVWSH